MAKVIIVLEDAIDGDNVIASLDMTDAHADTFGTLCRTRAIRLAQTLFNQVTSGDMREFPACSLLPGTTTVH